MVCDYVIRFIENDVEVGRQTGAVEKGQKNRFVIDPKGYVYDNHEGEGYTINSGDGYFNESCFEVYEGPLFDMSVNVEKEPEKYNYMIEFVECFDDRVTVYYSNPTNYCT